MNVMLGCKNLNNVSDVLYTMLHLNEMSCWKIAFVMCLIMCYLFMFVIITFMGGIYYKLFNFFSYLFQNMYHV